jgi:hypothetical protein
MMKWGMVNIFLFFLISSFFRKKQKRKIIHLFLGTTSVVLLACEFLRMAKPFVEDGVHPRVIVSGYRRACAVVLEKLKELAIDWSDKSEEELNEMLEKCAMTAMNSKLIAGHKEFFGPMVVSAVNFFFKFPKSYWRHFHVDEQKILK